MANHLTHKLLINLKLSDYITKEDFFCTKTMVLNYKLTLPLTKLVMVRVRLTNALTFLGDTPVGIQLVTFLLLCNASEFCNGAKTKKF